MIHVIGGQALQVDERRRSHLHQKGLGGIPISFQSLEVGVRDARVAFQVLERVRAVPNDVNDGSPDLDELCEGSAAFATGKTIGGDDDNFASDVARQYRGKVLPMLSTGVRILAENGFGFDDIAA